MPRKTPQFGNVASTSGIDRMFKGTNTLEDIRQEIESVIKKTLNVTAEITFTTTSTLTAYTEDVKNAESVKHLLSKAVTYKNECYYEGDEDLPAAWCFEFDYS